MAFLVWVSSVAAMAYVYYGVMRLPRGLTRLTAALPLMAFYLYMASRLETVFERGNYSFFFIWLTSFKIVLLCWDDGPAADPWAIESFPRFLAVMTLSLQIKRESFSERSSRRQVTASHTRNIDDWKAWVEWVDASQVWHMVILRLLFKLMVLMLVTSSYVYRTSIPSFLLYIIYSLHIYISCSLVFEGITAVVSPMLGIQLEAAYNKPFLAHSLSNFWGQRWNLLVSNLMRVSVYDPILHFLLRNHDERGRFTSTPLQQRTTKLANGKSSNERDLISKTNSSGSVEQFKGNTTIVAAYGHALDPPLWPRCVAMFSCFLVSGLMHELIFYIMSRSKPTWVATIFFTLNGAANILEVAVRRKTRFRLPKYISSPLTLTFVLVTAIRFFYPAIINEAGTDDQIIAEFQYFFHSLRQAIGVSQPT